MSPSKPSRLLPVILLLLLTSCDGPDITVEPPPPEDTQTPEAPPIEMRCVNFSGFPDNATFGMGFDLQGVSFTALGTRDLLVNDVTTSVHGLVFDEAGLRIDLPDPTTGVTLSAGAWFPQPLDVKALDSNANLVAQAAVPADNSLHSSSLTGADLTMIMITGGGGEGVLVELCFETEPEPEVAELCVDFLGFPDNATFGQGFTLEAVRFTALGTRELFVNDVTTSVHGLVFDEAGLQIEPSGSASTVTLSAGAWFPQPLDVDALDSSANPVDQVTVSADNSLHSTSLSAEDITAVVMTGGGGEGVLTEVCFVFH